MPKRILVTGSAGTVGRAASAELRAAGHFVRGLDREPTPDVDEALRGDVADRTLLDIAMQSIDTVIHLAAALEWLDFEEHQVSSNILGVYRMFEAAKQAKIQRIILASTVQVSGRLNRDATHPLTSRDGTYSYNTYGATKVFAEELGKVYSHTEKIVVLAARLCWMPRVAEHVTASGPRGRYQFFLSHDDGGRFFKAAVDAESIPPGTFHAMYVVSQSPPPHSPLFDVTEAKTLLNWEPRDTFPQGLPTEWNVPAILAETSPSH